MTTTDQLALNREQATIERNIARADLIWFCERVASLCPLITEVEVDFDEEVVEYLCVSPAFRTRQSDLLCTIWEEEDARYDSLLDVAWDIMELLLHETAGMHRAVLHIHTQTIDFHHESRMLQFQLNIPRRQLSKDIKV